MRDACIAGIIVSEVVIAHDAKMPKKSIVEMTAPPARVLIIS